MLAGEDVGRAETATGLGCAAVTYLGFADANGVDPTLGVGAAASLEAVENGLVKGLVKGLPSPNRVASAEQPESQIPTRPVNANRKMFRLTNNSAQSVIGLHPPNATLHTLAMCTLRVKGRFKMNRLCESMAK